MELEMITLEYIQELIQSKNVIQLRHIFDNYNLVDIAECLNEYEDITGLMFIFKTVPPEHTSDVFTYLDPEVQEKIISSLSIKQKAGHKTGFLFSFAAIYNVVFFA